jgi:hypothetical protein
MGQSATEHMGHGRRKDRNDLQAIDGAPVDGPD